MAAPSPGKRSRLALSCRQVKGDFGRLVFSWTRRGADLKHNVVFCSWHFENDVAFFGTSRFYNFAQVANGLAGNVVYQQAEVTSTRACLVIHEPSQTISAAMTTMAR